MAERGGPSPMPDIDLGAVRVRPSARILETPAGTVTLEPLMMRLLTLLAQRAGQLVSRREIFDACWGQAPVGDDSLNRVVAGLRKALERIGATGIRIRTVPGTGYVLRLDQPVGNEAATETQAAIEAAHDSWRLGLPAPDYLQIERLTQACRVAPDEPRLWGMLALMNRLAAEYDEPVSAADHLRACETAARRALALDPQQAEARTALTGIIPLFGGWGEARAQLEAIVADHPENIYASQDLATLLMATGYVTASKARRDRILARDPLAAVTNYKAVYQHWTVGDLTGMDRIADRAIQLWPTHPAVWMVRFWTLAFTARAPAALAMLADSAVRPPVPPQFFAYLKRVLGAAIDGSPPVIAEVVTLSRQVAATGPANAVAAFFALGLLEQDDVLFEIADAYYGRAGKTPVPLRHTAADLSLNEQHRRLTQVLFTPVFANVRGDPRFIQICEAIGLSDHWDAMGEGPDFLQSGTQSSG